MAFSVLGPCGVGVLWLAVYYTTAQTYPVRSWGYGNLVVGLSGMAIGLITISAGAALVIAGRRKR